jgi:hypothetical protein
VHELGVIVCYAHSNSDNIYLYYPDTGTFKTVTNNILAASAGSHNGLMAFFHFQGKLFCLPSHRIAGSMPECILFELLTDELKFKTAACTSFKGPLTYLRVGVNNLYAGTGLGSANIDFYTVTQVRVAGADVLVDSANAEIGTTPVCGIITTTNTNSVYLGFKPKLVLMHTTTNTDSSPSGDATAAFQPSGNLKLGGGGVYLTDAGFWVYRSSAGPLVYIAL